MKHFTKLNGGVAVAALGLAIIATPAFADQAAPAAAPAPAADAPSADVIVVTGSRIARRDLQSTVPIAVISNDKLTSTGATNVSDLLNTLPEVGQGVSRTSSNFSSVGNGEATVNLRNLGSSRTLVLINARRTLGIAGSSAADLNNIPDELVDHVEVVTGGASAVYGSEAIAGVVNFVTKRNFDGVQLHVQDGISDKGDAGRQYISVLAGHNFAGGAGNITLLGSYDKDNGLSSANRFFSAHDNPNRSSYAAQGLFSVADPATQAAFSPANGLTYTFDRNNAVKGYQGANIDGYDRNPHRFLAVPVERYNLSALTHYDFGTAELYGEGTYTKTKSNAALEALAVGNSGPGAAKNFDGSAYAGIPITSPYVPDAIRQAAIANGVNVIQFRRRSVDIFSRSNRNDRDYFRGVIGVKGSISSSWQYDVYYEHSQSRDFTTSGGIYAPNYGAALSNQAGPGGTVVCSDPVAQAAGCVPINIFGYNTVTPDAAKFLQTYTGPTGDRVAADGTIVHVTNGESAAFRYLAKAYQDVASAQITGKLFSLWAGPVAVAAGAEYRKERSAETFDPYTQLGLSSGNQLSNTVGRFDVKEGFVEVVAPIAADRPFVKSFGLEFAARYADYSTVGGLWTWKVGGNYAPVSDIRFNAVFARATRAPNIGELFSAQSQTFPAIVDPCDQAKGKGDNGALVPLPSACASIAGIAHTVQTRGAFAYGTAQLQTVDGLLGGNRNLKAETADTLTAGVVLTPSFFRNFVVKVDYYNIKVKNAVGIIGQQVSVDQCFQTANPVFCNNVIRDPNSGYITRVNALNLNTGSYKVSGLDTKLDYRVPARFLGEGGGLGVNVDWNHSFAQSQTPFPGGPLQDELGQADCYSCGRLGSGFKDRANAVFTVQNSTFNLAWTVQYLGPLVDVAGGTRISPVTYHGVKAQAFVGPNKKFTFYVGVNNLFDKTPQTFGDTNPVVWPGTGTVADTYDLFGRMLYVGATAKF
jgi:outer membrane receptor protein involved in Fe transport